MKTANQEIIYQSLKLTEETGVPMFIFGNPGAGKTTTVNDFRIENGYELTELRVQNSPEDIFGFDVNEEGKDTLTRKYPRWMIKILDDAKVGKKHILFIDEITTANMYVQAAMFQLIFNRGIEDIKLPDSCLIVAAGNYKANLSDEFEMLSPTLNRFCLVNLENGLTDDDINNYINRTLSVGDNLLDSVRKNKKGKSKAAIDKLLIDENGLEKEKALSIKKFINDVMEECPDFFDLDNKDYTWLKDVKGEMYGIMSPRTISYLSLILKNMIDRNQFSFKHVLGLIGFGSGSEICTDETKLKSFHKELKRCFTSNIVDFNKNIKSKCGMDVIENDLKSISNDLEFIGIFKDGEYSPENTSKAESGDLLENSLSISKDDPTSRTVIEHLSEKVKKLLDVINIIPDNIISEKLETNKNFVLIKDNLPKIIDDQLSCLSVIIKHAKTKICNSKTDIPSSRRKIAKIKAVSYDSLVSIASNMMESKIFKKNDNNSSISDKILEIEKMIIEINEEMDRI